MGSYGAPETRRHRTKDPLLPAAPHLLCNFIALHFLYGLSQLMPYPVVCARTFQSARCELLVPIQQSPGG